MNFEALLSELFSSLDGTLHIRSEVLDDMIHQNGAALDIKALAQAAGCQIMVGRTVGHEQEQFFVVSKKAGH